MTIEEIKKRLQEIVDALEDENSEADTEALEEELMDDADIVADALNLKEENA